MRTYQKVLAVIALSGMCLAAPLPSSSDPASKKHTKHHAVKPVKKDANAEKLRELKETVDAQQAAMQQMQQQVQQTQQQLQQTQQQLTQTQQTAQAADAKATAVETNTNLQVQRVQSDLTDVKTALNTTEVEVKKDSKRVGYLEHPLSLAYKNITLTPGGFLSVDGVYRQKATNSDVVTSFIAIPFNASPLAHVSEFRMTARVSRLTLLAESKFGKNKLNGYYEMDFLGAAPTANENQTTSFTPRQRQLFLQFITPGGWTFSGGQNWNLMVMNKKGIELRGEWIPATIEANYVVGWSYGRYANLRVTKASANKKTTFAIEADNPAYLPGGTVPPAIAGAVIPIVQAGQNNNTGGNLSTNVAPDVSIKLALDPGWGHYELKAVGRVFRERLFNATKSNINYGGGVGAGMILPVVKGKAEFYADGLVGRGIARYGDSSNVDFVTRSNGDLSPLANLQAIVGLETHPTPKLDWYAYAGTEYLDRNFQNVPTPTPANPAATTAFGYGAPNVNNAACFVPSVALGTGATAGTNSNATGTCPAAVKSLQEVASGVWYRFYKGSMGTLQMGLQAQYVYKNTWGGTNGAAVLRLPNAPKAGDGMVFTSLRYFIP